MLRASIVCASALLAFAGAALPAAAADDISKQIVDTPSPTAFAVYGSGAAGALRKDPAVQGGQALRVTVAGKGANPWDSGLSVAITKPIKAGDKLVLAFYAKLVNGENGATTATLPNITIQLAGAPYTGVFGGPTEIGTEWKLYSLTGAADRDYKPGELNVSFQLATAKQVIDFGPVFVLDLGPAS
jgi:hypothetical protein